MIAVLKHELRTYFRSLTAYVFGAFLLLFIGIGSVLYNLQAAVSNFEFVLGFSCLVFVVIVPILTMRVIAEERKQKTDQLLYSLPITTTQVVLGKYLALLVVYLIPLAIISLYPLIFSQYGDVYLLTAYGSILAFFILGAALIALGVFISSLTENQGFAAGIGIAVILLNYYSVSLSQSVSSTAFGSLAMMTSVLVSPSGIYEYEAAHGTVQRHYYKHLKGEKTSTNSMATLFAWSGALRKRGELDGLDELVDFADKLEQASIQTIEDGVMTGDLYALSTLENKTSVDTETFLREINQRLQKLLQK